MTINTVLISGTDDEHMASHSASGYSNGSRAPNSRKVGRAGMRVNHALAASGICAASRYGFKRGVFPHEVGVFTTLFADPATNNSWNANSGVDKGEQTIFTVFKAAGWKTALLGKHHFGAGPNVTSIADQAIDRWDGWTFPDLNGSGSLTFTPPPKAPDGSRWPDYLTRDEKVADWAVEHIHSLDPSDKLLLDVEWFFPHYPNYTKTEWLKLFDHVNERSDFITDSRNSATARYLSAQHGWDTTRFYRVIEALRDVGRLDSTLILQIADNGGGTGFNPKTDHDQASHPGPYVGDKGTVYNGGLGVPCFVTGPGIVAGSETDATFVGTDWLATLCSLCGVPYDETLTDGEDMSDILLGSGRKDRTKPAVMVTVEGHSRNKPLCYISPHIRLVSPAGHAGVAGSHDVFMNIDGTRFEFFRSDDLSHDNDLRGRATGVETKYRAEMQQIREKLIAKGIKLKGKTAGTDEYARRPHIAGTL